MIADVLLNSLLQKQFADSISEHTENGLDPYRYLLWLLQNAPQLSETDEAWAEKLLPANAPEECYMPHK